MKPPDALVYDPSNRTPDALNPFTGLDPRAPKGGGKGGLGFGGGSTKDDDDEDGGGGECSSSSTSLDCPSGRRPCGNFCIISSFVCCGEGGGDERYCARGDRCVRSSDEDEPFMCCPASDKDCDEDSADSGPALKGEPEGETQECESRGVVVRGVWALGAAGAVVALGL